MTRSTQAYITSGLTGAMAGLSMAAIVKGGSVWFFLPAAGCLIAHSLAWVAYSVATKIADD